MSEDKELTLCLVDLAAAINFCRDKADDVNVTTSDVRRAVQIASERHGYTLARASGWLPIETAPRDGTAILAARETAVYATHWHVDKNAFVVRSFDKLIECNPTHYMPLPPPPAKSPEV